MSIVRKNFSLIHTHKNSLETFSHEISISLLQALLFLFELLPSENEEFLHFIVEKFHQNFIKQWQKATLPFLRCSLLKLLINIYANLQCQEGRKRKGEQLKMEKKNCVEL